MWVCGLKQRCAIKATQGTHVTPYVGVWIETDGGKNVAKMTESHPMWVCGLKLVSLADIGVNKMSHPMWVCGLKHYPIGSWRRWGMSHPMWVCGLKQT